MVGEDLERLVDGRVHHNLTAYVSHRTVALPLPNWRAVVTPRASTCGIQLEAIRLVSSRRNLTAAGDVTTVATPRRGQVAAARFRATELSTMTLVIRHATADDAPRVADIYNQGIADRGATFETEPRTADRIRARIEDAERFPLLVAEDAHVVIGWAGLSAYRARACYAGIAEFSIYLDRPARGRGVGRQLLEALIATARERGYWKLLSRIFPFNTASRALCRACGFREVGVYEKHGQLDGQWLDVVIVERLIPENLGRSSRA